MKKYLFKRYNVFPGELSEPFAEQPQILSLISQYVNETAEKGWEVKNFQVCDINNRADFVGELTKIRGEESYDIRGGKIEETDKYICILVLYEKEA